MVPYLQFDSTSRSAHLATVYTQYAYIYILYTYSHFVLWLLYDFWFAMPE